MAMCGTTHSRTPSANAIGLPAPERWPQGSSSSVITPPTGLHALDPTRADGLRAFWPELTNWPPDTYKRAKAGTGRIGFLRRNRQLRLFEFVVPATEGDEKHLLH